MKRFGSLSLLQLAVFIVLLILATAAGIGSYAENLRSSTIKRSIEAPPRGWRGNDLRFAKERSEQTDWTANLLLNFSAGMFGSAVTFILISYILEKRQRAYYEQLSAELERKRLLRQMASANNALALQAVSELRANGALVDGGLAGADLTRANLSGADLSGAVLQRAVLLEANLQGTMLDGADFTDANLKGAILDRATAMSSIFRSTNCFRTSLVLTELSWANFENATFLSDSQLEQANMLWGATMPDGARYDGRFDLRGDREEAVRWAIHYTDPVARAAFYGGAVLDLTQPGSQGRPQKQQQK